MLPGSCGVVRLHSRLRVRPLTSVSLSLSTAKRMERVVTGVGAVRKVLEYALAPCVTVYVYSVSACRPLSVTTCL